MQVRVCRGYTKDFLNEIVLIAICQHNAALPVATACTESRSWVLDRLIGDFDLTEVALNESPIGFGDIGPSDQSTGRIVLKSSRLVARIALKVLNTGHVARPIGKIEPSALGHTNDYLVIVSLDRCDCQLRHDFFDGHVAIVQVGRSVVACRRNNALFRSFETSIIDTVGKLL